MPNRVLFCGTTALFTLFMLSAPAFAGSDCRPDEDCWRGDVPSRYDDDWYLHRPSTRAERAETAQLNRDYRYASEDQDIGPPPAPPEFADRDQYDRESADFREARARYENELVHYRKAMAEYDAKRAEYERARAIYHDQRAYPVHAYRHD